MSDGSIAIVGASCRFPGASSLEAYWELLASGTDAISQVDASRWSTRFYYHPTRGEPAKSYTWSAGLLNDVDLFEPAFFGISPREAAQMDPQQRMLLELVWHAAEDAGIPASKLAGSATGVYIGASATDYRDLRLGDPASGDSYFMTGGTLSILANRISYVFDLRGPSLTVDTACSSSLVALHHACEAIRERTHRQRDRRRHQPLAGALSVSRLLPRLDAVAPRPLLCLRRARRRLRARRRRRRHNPQAAAPGGGRRRSHSRGDPRHRRQFRRPHHRVVAAERGGAERPHPHGLCTRRRHPRRSGVFRDARHRYAGRRPDRGRRRWARARPSARRAAADRLGQDQYRAFGAGLGDGWADQGDAGARARQRAANAALRDTEPKHPLRRAQPAARPLRRDDRGRKLRRGQLVRLRRHQRARCADRATAAFGGGTAG